MPASDVRLNVGTGSTIGVVALFDVVCARRRVGSRLLPIRIGVRP
jgi:hypothetical protein